MAARFLEGSSIGQVDLKVYHVEGGLYQHISPVDAKSLFDLLQPITDASHTRDRKRSPPDSACLPGTRELVVKSITAWASKSALRKVQHFLWVYGLAGSGKSSIAQEVSKRVHGGGRLLASFFFCRNAGHRSTTARFPNTLASQLAKAIPQAAQLIEAAVRAEPDLVNARSSLSLDTRLHSLVYSPFKEAIPLIKSFSHPYLIVIDGLDECEDKDGVREFLTSTFRFFDENPYVPLRIFITSRVEQHIRLHLSDDRVLLRDLGDESARDDIKTFLGMVFGDAIKARPVIQAYIRQNGPWPKPEHFHELTNHVGGSFILASTLANFIFHGIDFTDSHLTPMDRLPLAVKLDPGLDGLYAQTLARADDRARFRDVISTVALLAEPLPISGIAELLGIQTYEVTHVLEELQAIIRVPGTDNEPVTFCHTSLRDFLTTEGRSSRFFAPPSFHAQLLIHGLSCELRVRRRTPNVGLDTKRLTTAVQYSLQYCETVHWDHGWPFFSFSDLERLVQLRREMVQLLPDDGKASGLHNLGIALHSLFNHSQSIRHVEEAISAHREALHRRPHPHPERYSSLNNLGCALYSLFEHDQSVSHIEEATSVHREALHLRPHPHPDRRELAYSLGCALYELFNLSGSLSRLEEAVLMLREALSLHPHPHPERHSSLYDLACALKSLFTRGSHSLSDLKDAISLHREALSLRPHPHPDRPKSLFHLAIALYRDLDFAEAGTATENLDEVICLLRENLALGYAQPPNPFRLADTLHSLLKCLQRRNTDNWLIGDLEEAIAYARELVLEHYGVGHKYRDKVLEKLASLLQIHFDITGDPDDLDEIEELDAERQH